MKKELIRQSMDYIIQYIDESLSIEDVAEHFHFSKFYFCRSFQQVTGESAYEFIKRLKPDQSTVDMRLEENKSITDIGLGYGHSPSNYSSALRKHRHISPSEFYKSTHVTDMANPFYPEGLSRLDPFEEYDHRITMQELPDFFVIYERMIGNYVDLKEKWFDLLDRYKDDIKSDILLIKHFYNDPSVTSLNSCLYDICFTANEFCKLDQVTTVKGGKFATYRFEGDIQDIFGILQGLFGVWLPESGYKMDGRCGLNIYRKINREKNSVIMDPCIPMK